MNLLMSCTVTGGKSAALGSLPTYIKYGSMEYPSFSITDNHTHTHTHTYINTHITYTTHTVAYKTHTSFSKFFSTTATNTFNTKKEETTTKERKYTTDIIGEPQLTFGSHAGGSIMVSCIIPFQLSPVVILRLVFIGIIETHTQ